jgi:hypothetical protein
MTEWMLTALIMMSSSPTVVEPEEVTRRLAGKTIQVEDLVTSLLGVGENRRLRLLRCSEISFRLDESAPKEISGNVRVTGKVRVEASQVVVDVSKVELLPSDVEQFEIKKSSISGSGPKAWYELAEWAEKRFGLYQNGAMHELAAEAYRRGIAMERQQAGDDVGKLELLRQRMMKSNIVNDLDDDEIAHHLAVARLPHLSTASADDLEKSAKEWGESLGLPESVRAPSNPAEMGAYEQDPVGVYRRATAPQRPTLVRGYQVKLLRLAAEKRVAAKEWDAYQASQWTAEKLPEEPATSRRWLELGISAEEAKLVTLRFRDVEKLARRVIEGLEDIPRADAIRKRWLNETEAAMRAKETQAEEVARAGQLPTPLRDVRARYDLAGHRLFWFPNDPEQKALAADLYQEGLAIEPTFEPAIEGLRSLGYRRDSQGKWQDPQTAEQVDRQLAEQPRSPAIGMEDSAVRKILGQPDSQSRIITGPRLVERQWRYQGFKETTYLNLRTDGAGRWRVSDIRKIDNDAAGAERDQVE